MGTAGGEPRVLLNALKPMLGVVGDIKTPQEVLRVVGMMKDAEKLMSRCVYLNILKATCRQAKQNEEKRETLEKFLTTGGWGILNKWLHEFTKSENFPVLLELIDVLKILPITVDLLKQGNTGKLIKQMTKLEHADVKKNAGMLIRQWKDMIRGGPEKKVNDNEENADDTFSNKRNRDLDGRGPPEKRPKLKPGDKKILDSSGFMMALNAAAPVAVKKKRRNSDSKTTLPLDEILSKTSMDKKAKLEVDSDKVQATPDSPLAEDDSPFTLGPSPAVEAANQAFAQENDTGVVIDEGSIARKKNKKKRNITWPPDDQLVKIKYFELLEGERKGHHAENFSQARQHELQLEKQALRAARRSEDKMNERIRWSRLIPVDNAGVPNFTPGEKSREKYFQAEREKSVLAFIFLTKDSLPDYPSEPDFDADEHGSLSQPRPIPHDEEGNIFPPKTSNPAPSQRQSSVSDDDVSSPTSKNPPNNNRSNNKIADVSPAVQNIMSQLLRNNNTFSNEQQNGLPVMSGMAPPLLGKPGMMDSGPPPPPNVPPENNNFPTNPDNIPSIMSTPIPNPHARGNGGRFNGNRGMPPMNRGRGNFNPRGPRSRWDDHQQGPNDDWNNYTDNFNENFDSYNDQFNGNFRGGGHFGHQGRNENFHENFGNHGGRGFRRGGMNNRGRGWIDRGRGMMNHGSNRPNMRGGGNFDRREGGNDWYPDGEHHDRRDFGGNRGRGGRNDKNICQHFNTPRGCRSGDRCKFMHLR